MIRFLLGIVKDARPQNALTAGVTALAFEEGCVYALCVWDETADAFDEAKAAGEPTKREWVVKKL